MTKKRDSNEGPGLSRRGALGLLAAGSAASVGVAAASQPAAPAPSASNAPVAPTGPAPFPGKIALSLKDSQPFFPPAVTPKAGSPNVIFMVLDDVGFSDLGCYGSEIPTPNFDRLAAGGLQYTNFRTTAMCSPTRASLLTGLNHHSAGMGWLADIDTGFPGYRGDLTHEAATMAEFLREHGWNTYLSGKWHINAAASESFTGPTRNWPCERGFQHSYWFMGHSTDYFHPSEMYEGSEPIEVGGTPDYYSTDDFADRALDYVRTQHAQSPNRPFFLHLAFNGAHSPLQCRAEDRDFFKGRYAEGWDKVREQRLARQKALGIAPPETVLPPRNPGIKAWDELTPKERRLFARYMEVYAGMIRRLDYNAGRLMDELETMGLLDNTLIFVISDNGASGEGTPEGTPNVFGSAFGSTFSIDEASALYDEMGGPDTVPHYPMGWAMASNTPFKMYKQYTFLGGIADPLLVHWPKGLQAKGQLRKQFVHVCDIYPTVLDVLGLEPLKSFQGRAMKPIEGASFRSSFVDPAAAAPRSTQYFELGGQRAIYADGWHAVTLHPRGAPYENDKWELYHHAQDFNEVNDLAASMPEKVRELEAAWLEAAQRHAVLPLDDRNVIVKLLAGRQREAPRPHWEIRPPIKRLTAAASPPVAGRDHTIAVELERRAGDDGVLVAYGSIHWGFVLYVQDNRLVYEFSLRPYSKRMVSDIPMPTGKLTVKYVQTMVDRPFKGKGALFIGDRQVAEMASDRMLFGTSYEGMEIGRDAAAPVSRAYQQPFAFKGHIEKVSIDLDISPPSPDEMKRFMQLIQIKV
jgi:arylsulfatase